MHTLPTRGFLRLPQIIGSQKTSPPTPALIPIGKSAWWNGVRSGRFPKPVKLGRVSMWRVEDVIRLIEETSGERHADGS